MQEISRLQADLKTAEAALVEAQVVARDGSARIIRGARVNLRAGPSTNETVFSVLTRGTPVFPQLNEGEWVLVQISGGPAGWIHGKLIGGLASIEIGSPAAQKP
ncbi:MAG: SH3 domain-containing protein [Proteobacteria bacterium]|nr:SH3 domain-containing protein [Pseudomonadota bacterium]